MQINSHSRKIQKHLIIGIFNAVCLAAMLPKSANALEWLLDPRVTLEQGYDDNFFLDSNSSLEDEVSTTNLTGELALRGKSDRTEIETLARIDVVNYGGDDERLDEKGNQLFSLSSLHSITDRNGLKFDADLTRDTITRTEAIVVDPGDIGIGPDGELVDDVGDTDINLVGVNVRRSRFTLNPGWNFRFSQRTNGSLEYRYTDVSYSNDRDTGLEEFDQQNLIGSLRYRISEKSTITGQISAGFFRPDDNQDVDTYEARLGFLHRLSETLQLDFAVGPRYSDFENSIESSDSGVVASIGATKNAGLTTYRVDLRRQVNASGSGNQVETDTLNLNIRRALSPTLDFRLLARVFETENTDDDTNSSSDREFIQIEPGLNWQFAPSWSAGLSYKYREIDRDIGGTGDSNAAFFSISYLPPRQF